MATVPSQEIEYTDDDGNERKLTYLFHPDHRNNNPNKSQWSITQDHECDSFVYAWENDWTAEVEGWGLYFANGSADYLGVAIDRSTQLFIAKYVCKNNQAEWHGYPADHTRNGDRPTRELLALWLQSGSLPPEKISKISQGKRCTL